jgi:hypothetical protein
MTASPARRLRTLSKSDFKLASSCEAKLYFRKNGYRDNRDENPTLDMLASAGYMIEALAKAAYPAGVHFDYSGDGTLACQRTCDFLKTDGATLFEGVLLRNRRYARADILQRKGDTIRLIEIKSGSVNGAGHRESLAKGGRGVFFTVREPFTIRSEKRSYLEDLTYQVLIAEQLFPGLRIEPYLCLVDKSTQISVDDAHTLFEMIRDLDGDGPGRVQTARFTGDAALLAQLGVVTEVSVAAEVAVLRDEVEARAARLESLLDAPLNAFVPARSAQCRGCEFRVGDGEPDGFGECWGALAEPSPHMLDLHDIGSVRTTDGRGAVEWLFDAGKASLFDIPDEMLTGSVAERQRRQISAMRSGEFWKSPELRSQLEVLRYPLHFIDFEAASPALPYHSRMRPYGQVAFQWSAHTMASPGAPPQHAEWLNAAYVWPNEQFVRTLRKAIGDAGSVVVWTGFERTALRGVMRDMATFGVEEPPLTAWLTDLTENRIVDMHRWAWNHFYHPGMGGSASIKVVLDALWRGEPQIRADFERLTGLPANADADPYASLPARAINGVQRQVREGAGAVTAYEAMMYGEGRNEPAARDAWRELLLQ